jgi:hypothetical protein
MTRVRKGRVRVTAAAGNKDDDVFVTAGGTRFRLPAGESLVCLASVLTEVTTEGKAKFKTRKA